MAEERLIYLPDLHVPENIALDPVLEFIEDFKPTKIILGGDVHDFTAVCEWIADQSRALDGGTIAQSYQEMKDSIFSPLRKAYSRANVIYLLGNHEDWIRQALLRYPNGRGFWEVERNVPSWVTVVPLNQAYHVNQNVCFLHGLYTNKYHAYQTVHAVHKSIFYGHTHDIQRYTDISPIDVTKFYTGASCGCLCTLNPHYMKNKPNRWVNGFLFMYVDTTTEEFADTQVYIIRNHFWALGRKYK